MGEPGHACFDMRVTVRTASLGINGHQMGYANDYMDSEHDHWGDIRHLSALAVMRKIHIIVKSDRASSIVAISF